ncbi:MAG: phage portal protein [Sulfurimonas sp.]|nr:phage portal protein [Sulfurimonas sp.]
MATDTQFDLINYIQQTSLIQGSPNTTYGKSTFDGNIEKNGDLTRRSRRDINYHLLNGTDISAFLNAEVTGVIGSGVNIQSRTGVAKIDKSFESYLEEHSESDNFETSGMWGRDEAWAKIIHFSKLQGGIIVRHHYNNSWKIPYKMEIISIDMIDFSKNFRQDNVENGLKKDKYQKVIGIYLYDKDRITSTLYPMENMTYYINAWTSISQKSAISQIVSLLPTLDDYLQHKSSAVKGAIERAKNGVYWHTELYDTLLEAINEEIKTSKTSAGSKVLKIKDLMTSLASRGVGVSGATTTPKDDKITQISSKIDSELEVISHQSQKEMAAAVGGSKIGIYKDSGDSNYAGIMGVSARDEVYYKSIFNIFKTKIIDEYLVRLFQVGIQSGSIELSKAKYFENPKKYMKWDVLRTSKIVLDPAKDAVRVKNQLLSGATNLGIVYAEKAMDWFDEESKKTDIEIRIEQMRIDKWKKAGLENPNIKNEKDIK